MTGAQIAANALEGIRHGERKRLAAQLFNGFMYGAIGLAFLALVALIGQTAVKGLPGLSLQFFTNFPSRINPSTSGAQSAIVGTVYLTLLTAVFVIPVGIATALYLEEYADKTRWWNRLIEVNIQNLAAVPSVVYGILGLAFIVRGPLGIGPVLLAGGLTLGLLVLPVVIIVARESIRAVPPSIRDGALALGATKWQTVSRQVLPSARAGIVTGVILSLSRAIGETAPLLVIGAASSPRFNPSGLNDAFTALPIQIFTWTQDPNPQFVDQAATASIVLLLILLGMNGIAIVLRNRYEQRW
ncbi:MAG: phosphate ABC transporter permease PstA [Solirubrobacterales bacterium]|nr:phosphate ABC transporter permease PstA [Solirubrobacterales bacterium]